MRHAFLVLAATCSLFTACYNPDLSKVKYTCSAASSSCPDGLICAKNGMCQTTDEPDPPPSECPTAFQNVMTWKSSIIPTTQGMQMMVFDPPVCGGTEVIGFTNTLPGSQAPTLPVSLFQTTLNIERSGVLTLELDWRPLKGEGLLHLEVWNKSRSARYAEYTVKDNQAGHLVASTSPALVSGELIFYINANPKDLPPDFVYHVSNIRISQQL